MNRSRPRRMLWLLLLVLIFVFLFSFSLGRYSFVPPGQVVKILINGVLPDGMPHFAETWANAVNRMVIHNRLPRIVVACLVGCCLSTAGGSYQGVFQNPMAAPDILGASTGAAFGAALAILMGASSWKITLSAFVFSLLTVGIVFLIAQKAPGQKVINLILAGIMLSSLFSAGTSYIKLVADPTDQLPAIEYWMMGSLNGMRLRDVTFVLPFVLIGCIPLLMIRWRINLLTLGDEEAQTLGIHTGRLRMIIILCATLITAASVSVSGMIGWVGLVIPHLCRKLVGSDYRYLMPASMIAGAAFLLVVDDVSRNLLQVEIPIGILTAFVGAPFFVYLILRREKTL
ncbi:MAG: iron ABC transporter permease [Clostridiales bacterium]|nr:iron ABC transporter permease [Clostridiales bacterium]